MKAYTLITGATGGLGKAFAVACAEQGHNLILTDISNEKLEILGESLKARYKTDILWAVCNLMEQEAREKLFKQLDALAGEIRFTINVAGLDFEGGVETLNSSKVSRVMRVNTEATLDITRYSAATKHSDAFYIINVASMAGFYPMPLKALYSASKRAIIQFSLAVREEIKEKNGHITVLCPAGLRTNAKVINKIESQGLMGRLTTIDTGKVVVRVLKCVRRGRPILIPGLINVLIVHFSRLVPDITKARFVFKRWRDAQVKYQKQRLPKGREVLYD